MSNECHFCGGWNACCSTKIKTVNATGGNVVFDAPPEMLSNYVAPTIPVINVDMDKLARRCCDRGEDHWWGLVGKENNWVTFNFCPDCGTSLAPPVGTQE